MLVNYTLKEGYDIRKINSVLRALPPCKMIVNQELKVPSHVEIVKTYEDLHPATIYVNLTSDVLMVPDALKICHESLSIADYISGCDLPSKNMALINNYGGRSWRLPGIMDNENFITRLGTYLQDKLIHEEEYRWDLLQLVHKRKCASPIPGLWITNIPTPNIPWDKILELTN